jgi:flagellar biogenesis protein FliO
MTRGRLTASFALIVGALLSLAAPAPALAKAIEDVLLGSDPQDVMITVLADQPLNAPTVRTYAGSLRIRLYDAKDTPLLKLTGDGGAVRSVDVANGSDQSAAVVVTFTDRTRLATSDVRVERDGSKIVLRIARGLLPALRENAPAATAVALKPTPAAVPTLTPAPAPVAAPVAKPTPAVAPVAAKPPAAKPPAAAAESKKPATALGQPKPKQDAKQELKLAKGGDSSAVPVLIAVSALLALCYGVLRLVLKKNSAVDIPAIDVIAQKRLGPRHQLVIVRAFDRDYLLSVQGGQTTVVARSSRKRLDDAEDMLSPLPFKRAPVGELPDLSPPKNPSRVPAKPASTPPRQVFNREPFEDDEVTFGGELFKQALEQRERVRDQTASMRLEAARAEARAELARLESDRDEYVAPKPSLPGFAAKPAQPSAEPDDQLIEAPKAADAMMSESVSGLLRLRKASGR